MNNRDAVRYNSTRGTEHGVDFTQVLLRGLASDGGLYVPAALPVYDTEELQRMRSMDYRTLAGYLLEPFVRDALDAEQLQELLQRAYADFAVDEVVQLRPLSPGLHLLELFHGPTLAFKDIAMQLLGQLLNAVLSVRGERRIVLTATSGDTGSAAIEACRNCEHLQVIVLYPHERITEFQRLQITTSGSPRVHALAVDGNFDDCQALLKQALAQGDLSPSLPLITANSINWARLMAQLVYYFYAALRLDKDGTGVSFAVPTGNFGNIYAGCLARQMGLNIRSLLLATNRNDILHRALADNDYSKGAVFASLAPSMDISVASNFERLVHFLTDSEKTAQLFNNFSETGVLRLPDSAWHKAQEWFVSSRWDDAQLLDEMRRTHSEFGYTVDPHTAAALSAARAADRDEPVVALATAHPVKFSGVLKQAGLALENKRLDELRQRTERFTRIGAQYSELKQAVQKLGLE